MANVRWNPEQFKAIDKYMKSCVRNYEIRKMVDIRTKKKERERLYGKRNS